MLLSKNIAILTTVFALHPFAAADTSINFNRDIRPILSDKCFHCHGPDEEDRKEDLRLDIPDGKLGALTPRDDYYIIKPGEPEESELWFRITSDYEDEVMPPEDAHKAPLTDSEIERVTQWIKEGGAYEDYWAFLPPKRQSPPPAEFENWNGNPIDRIVFATLKSNGLQPKEEADKRTLIRRLSFDLTGLPPTIEEIDEFLSDSGSDAYENLVDRLLDRPAYGEHMARHWADLVRLGDTNGMHKDFHREFSPYRDWLIRSFNENLPYDQFISYQLAGDEYENPTRDHLIASGFNRLHMIIDKGTALPEESLHKNVVDRVEAFGTTFLGLTVQCAQCHDHKYDPITQEDYFRLYAFFNNFAGNPETVREPERGLQPPYINLTNPKQDQKLAEYEARRHDAQIRLEATARKERISEKWPDANKRASIPFIASETNSQRVEFRYSVDLESKPEAALVRFFAMSKVELYINGHHIGDTRASEKGAMALVESHLQAGSNTIKAIATGPKEGFALRLDYRIDGIEKQVVTSPDWSTRTGKNEAWKSARISTGDGRNNKWTETARSLASLAISRELDQIDADRRTFLETIPAAMTMAERVPARQTFILTGGAYDAPGAPVERGTPAFLPPMRSESDRATRKDLADWLVSTEHPLTARVAVNRFWQSLFGVGLVKTSEDFGAQGEWPSHPEVLDELSSHFIESGWNIKKLIKRIVTTNTYKQSSNAPAIEYEQDPENRLLSRGSRFRLDAEAIRDQILAVSGQLNRTLYGKSVKPPQPPGLWEMVSMTSVNSTYIPDKDDNIYRRSFYTYWRRGMPPPQMTILNAPSREFCVARRERTNTSLQALLLMNESEYFNAAKETAKLALGKTRNVEDGLSLVYEMITSHLPDQDRLDLMKETLASFRESYTSKPELAKAIASSEDQESTRDPADLAAWTLMTHSLFNLEIAKVRR